MANFSDEGIGHVIVGDMDVHLRPWLCFSQRDSAEGNLLRGVTESFGLKQMVRQPTREGNLLDLVFTDIEGVNAAVGGKIADHQSVMVTTAASVPTSQVRSRTV